MRLRYANGARSETTTRYRRDHFGSNGEDRPMRLTIEIARRAAPGVLHRRHQRGLCRGGKTGRSADGLSCSFSVPAERSPAARCAAIRRQCGGKFYANYCGDKMLSADVSGRRRNSHQTSSRRTPGPITCGLRVRCAIGRSNPDYPLSMQAAIFQSRRQSFELLLARNLRLAETQNSSTWTRRYTSRTFLTNFEPRYRAMLLQLGSEDYW